MTPIALSIALCREHGVWGAQFSSDCFRIFSSSQEEQSRQDLDDSRVPCQVLYQLKIKASKRHTGGSVNLPLLDATAGVSNMLRQKIAHGLPLNMLASRRTTTYQLSGKDEGSLWLQIEDLVLYELRQQWWEHLRLISSGAPSRGSVGIQLKTR